MFCLLYSGKFSLVQNFAGLLQILQKKLSQFLFSRNERVMLGAVDCHTPKANLITCRNDEVKKQTCATMADFYRVSGLLLWVCRTEGISTVDLNFDTCSFGASFTALSASCIAAG